MTYLEKIRQALAEKRAAHDQAIARADAIVAAAEADEKRDLTPVESTDLDAALADARSLGAEIDELEGRESDLVAAEERRQRSLDAAPREDAPTRGRKGADPFDVRDLSFMTPASEFRARGVAAAEAAIGDLDDDHRAAVVQLIERRDPTGAIARRVIATGSPAYRSAFQKIAAGHGHLLVDDERQAVMRAQSLTDGGGGFAVPFTLDPTLILSNSGAANPFRRIARVETIATDTWNGIASTGVSGGYAAEASEVGDDAMTLTQPSVKPERWDVFVPFSFEIGADWTGLEAAVREAITEKREEFDAAAFTTGSGTNAPTGIITALDGGASELSPATAETFAVADVYAVEEALPPKYRRTGRARWMSALGTYNTMRQFASDDGHALLARLSEGEQGLLGRVWEENSEMDDAGSINAAATADNHVLLFGDFRNYLIVDRVGMNMELVPHLFATANNRPSGQRGFLAWGRTGGGCLNINAFRVLNVATTA